VFGGNHERHVARAADEGRVHGAGLDGNHAHAGCEQAVAQRFEENGLGALAGVIARLAFAAAVAGHRADAHDDAALQAFEQRGGGVHPRHHAQQVHLHHLAVFVEIVFGDPHVGHYARGIHQERQPAQRGGSFLQRGGHAVVVGNVVLKDQCAPFAVALVDLRSNGFQSRTTPCQQSQRPTLARQPAGQSLTNPRRSPHDYCAFILKFHNF
jgi:hypothetical protein